MSLAKKAASGFFWTTIANVGSRLITIACTFILTRYLAPAVQGEVNVAFVFILTVSAATTLGVPQYIATHPKAGRDVVFHGSALLVATGLLAALACLVLRHPVGAWLNTPGMAAYVPGLALSAFIERVGSLPRNILVRDMRFRVIGTRVALGETVYAAASIAFAHLGFGGHAIVVGNLVRATVGLAYLAAVTDIRDYLLPTRLQAKIFRQLWDYGFAISISFLFHIGSVNWDNLFISYRFGEAATGLYNQAYRIAELPALSVGEQINDVLVPSLARLEEAEARRRGILRAMSLMALVVFPMSAGIGAVSYTLVETLYPPEYQGVAPYLAVLVVISVYRSIGSLATGYLQVVNRTKAFIFIDFVFVVVLLASMALLAPFGPLGTAAGAGIAFTINTLQMVRALRPEGILVRSVARAIGRPLLACALMIAAVLALHAVWGHKGPAVLRLLAQIALGGLIYVGAALLFARVIAKDFIDLALSIARRKRSRPEQEEAPEAPKEPL